MIGLLVLLVLMMAGPASQAQTVGGGGCTFNPCQPSVQIQPNSVLQSDTSGKLFMGPVGGSASSVLTQCVTTAVAAGTGDAITVPKLPCVPTTTLLVLTLTATNTTTSPTIKTGNQLPMPVLAATSGALTVGALSSGSRVLLTSNGNKWFLLTPSLALPELFSQLLSPSSFGAVGDGTTDDTVPVQAAITACSVLGLPLQFDAVHLYKVTSTLNIINPCLIEGPYRYGIWVVNQPTGAGSQICPWGLVTKNTGITMINAEAVTGTIRGLCIDMTGDQTVNPTGGAAIQVKPPSISTYSAGWHIEQNTILNPYIGITIPGNGPGAGCCGMGTSADGDAILRNTIVSPAAAGILIGQNSAATSGGPGTVGITITDNAIVCKTTTSKASGYGIRLYEGAIWYDGTQNGPEGCHEGTAVTPGVLSGSVQAVELNADGVLGDASGLHDFLVQPNGGAVNFVTIGGKGPWSGSTGTTNSALIDCTNANTCQNISITGALFHGGTGNFPVLEIDGGANGPFNVQLTGNNFCNSGPGGNTATGLKLVTGSSGGRWSITGNQIGTGCLGLGVLTGIDLTVTGGNSVNGAIVITGNDLSWPAIPIAYTPNANDAVVIRDNQGLDDVSTTVTVDGGSTSITPAGMFFGIIGFMGSGSPTIATMPGGYANQHIEMVNNYSGGTVTFSGSSFCNTASMAQEETVLGRWNAADSCWNLK